MQLTLDEIKSHLRLDIDETDEDIDLEQFGEAAELYYKNSIGTDFDKTNPLASLYVKVLITDFYENRELEGKASVKTRHTLSSIALQLKYSV